MERIQRWLTFQPEWLKHCGPIHRSDGEEQVWGEGKSVLRNGDFQTHMGLGSDMESDQETHASFAYQLRLWLG